MTDIQRAAELLVESVRNQQPVVAFTGAGISQESGIPTFRGTDGIWQKHDPREVVTVDGFNADPKRSWVFHEQLRDLCRSSRPNPGHLALAWIETAVGDRAPVPVITQNIDGLHQAAGSHDVVELHGSCHRMRCTECDFVTDKMPERLATIPPVCDCGAILRPDVVWFGEQLPQQAMDEAQNWAQAAGVMVVIGTSATVQPAASLPMIALRSGASIVEVNPESTPLSSVVDVSLRAQSGEIMPTLAERVGTLLNEPGPQGGQEA